MVDFIKLYYKELITCISCLVTLITFIFKDKSNNKSKKIFRILQVLPFILDEAENTFKDVSKSGLSKLQFVLNKLQVLCSEVSLKYDEDFWINKIEGILSAPQKNKGGSINEE